MNINITTWMQNENVRIVVISASIVFSSKLVTGKTYMSDPGPENEY